MIFFKKNWQRSLPYSSQISYIKDIEERNKAFHSLIKSDQKKEVALDVLHLIHNQSISGSWDAYWDIDFLCNLKEIKTLTSSKEFQKYLLGIEERNCNMGHCEVCARGAVMFSTIRLGNKISLNTEGVESGKKVETPFTFKEMLEMECIYENMFENSDIDLDEKSVEVEVNRFNYPHSPNSTECLINIFLNVLYNGQFKVEDKTNYLPFIIK